MEAEHAPRRSVWSLMVAPNQWATLSVHVVASASPRRTPGSHAALEVGGLTVVVIAVALCLFYQKSIYLSIYLQSIST